MKLSIIDALILITLSSLLSACHDGGSSPIFEQEIKITPLKEINLEEHGILKPSHLLVLSNSVIVTGNDNIISVFDRDFTLRFRKGGTGQGPQEFMQIFSIDSLNDNEICLYDSNLGIVRAMNFKDSTLDMRTLIDGIPFRYQVSPLNDDKFLSLNIQTDNSYEILDNNGILIDSLSYWPTKPEKISEFTHHLACTGPACISKDRHMAVRSIWANGKIDCFAIDNTGLKHLWNNGFFDMEYDVEHSSVDLPKSNENTRVGYVYTSFGKNCILASYSGSLIDEGTEIKEIHQYSLDGKPQIKYLLEDGIGRFVYDAMNHQIIALGSHNGEKSFLRIYDIGKN